MLTLLWLDGLVVRRPGRLLGAMAGVTLTVALLASIEGCIAVSVVTMTRRAVAEVPVDWQVQLAPGTDMQQATAALRQATPFTALETVGDADTAGLSAQTGGTTQTTGPGKVLGLSSQYRDQFPSELRSLIGAPNGVLVAQQTAANLHVTVGDSVMVERVGLPAVAVMVDGVVDLPNADSLFQAVAVPAGGAPQAPPDNMLLLPSEQWHRLFDPQATVRPETVRTQLHVRLTHDLPAAPEAAYAVAQQRAHNLEARLGAVRADALYVRVLFLFLGLPGGMLAALLTVAVAAAGLRWRRREQALLRVRGASTSPLLQLASLEALVVGVGGVALGLALAAGATRLTAPAGALVEPPTRVWIAGAVLVGLALALAAVLTPAWLQARHTTVAIGRVVVGRPSRPLWQHLYLDLILLAVSAIAFWQTAGAGYQIVLASEGVAQSSVAY